MRATFEEGSEIQVEAEAPAFAAGWGDQHEEGSEIFRTGSKVEAVFRVKNAAKAAKLITTLSPEYRPGVAVTDSAGKIEVKVNGEVVSLQTLVELEAAQNITAHILYRAAGVSP